MERSFFHVLIIIGSIGVYLVTAQRNNNDCRRTYDDELIWEYNIRRPHILGISQEADAEYGPTMAIITCIRIDSLSDEDNQGGWITSGGVGTNYLKLRFKSKYSRGLRYQVFVYGRSTLNTAEWIVLKNTV